MQPCSPVSPFAFMPLPELASLLSSTWLLFLQLSVTPANLWIDCNAEGLEVTVLHLSHTKAAALQGEDVHWSSHPGPTDLYAALQYHLCVNSPPSNAHLFAYCHKGQPYPLTKPTFIRCLTTTAC